MGDVGGCKTQHGTAMVKDERHGGSKHPLPMWNKQSKDDEDDYDSHEQNEIM